MLFFLILVVIVAAVSSSKKVQQSYFNPGFEKSFHFFDVFPDLQSDPNIINHCLTTSCGYSVMFKASEIISNSPRFTVSVLDDEGYYSLRVTLQDATSFIAPHLINMTANYLYMLANQQAYLSRPLPLEFSPNTTAAVACPVLGLPLPEVGWEVKVGDQIRAIVPDDEKYVVTKMGHLFIFNFAESDEGLYSCSAINECGKRGPGDVICSKKSVKNSGVELKLRSTPDTLLGRLDFYFLNPVTEPCWVETGCYEYYSDWCVANMFLHPNSDVNVEVFVDVAPNSSYAGARMSYHEKSDRFLSLSDKICYGILRNYTFRDVLENIVECTAIEKWSGLDSFNFAKYEIAIMETPNVTFSLSTDKVRLSSNFSIDFPITNGNKDDLKLILTLTEFSCFLNGRVFQMNDGWHKQCYLNRTSEIVTISVTCATDLDTGFYQVEASNWVGSTVSDPVYIETYSSNSYQGDSGYQGDNDCYPLLVTVLSSTSARLSWTEPLNNRAAPLVYTVILNNTVWDETMTSQSTGELYHVLEGLHPGVKYSVYVESLGDLVGQRKDFSTHEDVPSEGPDNLQCSSRPGSTELACEWGLLPIQKRNGAVETYKVSYQQSEYDSEWTDSYVPIRFVNLKQLQPCSSYAIEVSGCTAVGCGSPTRTSITTQQEKPSHKPSLRYKIPGVRSIRLGWSRPEGIFRDVFYRVRCQERVSGRSVFLVENTTLEDAVVTGGNIHSGTKYRVVVTPFNSQGFGPVLMTDVSTLTSSSPALTPSFPLFLLLTSLINLLLRC